MDVEHFAMLIGYIDPGIGSMLFQIIAAGLISAGLFFRGMREWIVGVALAPFRGRKSANDTNANDAAAPSNDTSSSKPAVKQRRRAA